jgi:hypothetical protein
MRDKPRCRFITGNTGQGHTPSATQIGSYTTEYRYLQSQPAPRSSSRRRKRIKQPLTLQQEETVARVIVGTISASGRRSSNAHPTTQCPFCGCQVRVTRLKKHLTRCPSHARDVT